MSNPKKNKLQIRNSTVDFLVFTKHLNNVYESGELAEDSTCAKFARVDAQKG